MDSYNAEIIAHIFNMSILSGGPPRLWNHSQITPIPKVNPPNAICDFRPISVTPLLSR